MLLFLIGRLANQVFRCALCNNISVVTFDELGVIMDDNEIFTFSTIMIEMAPSNDICNQDR